MHSLMIRKTCFSPVQQEASLKHDSVYLTKKKKELKFTNNVVFEVVVHFGHILSSSGSLVRIFTPSDVMTTVCSN